MVVYLFTDKKKENLVLQMWINIDKILKMAKNPNYSERLEKLINLENSESY